jgi:predicted nucleic acid-binding protein
VSGFLLDTNIPSELIRTRPEPRVEKWVYAQDEQSLHLSVVSIGELRRGLVILPPSKRRTDLERWFENDLLPRFHGRILGTPLNTADGMIAATAVEHGLTVVTRNVRDYAGLGAEVFNPWNGV